MPVNARAMLRQSSAKEVSPDATRIAAPGQTVYCRAECYKLARQVAFTRAVCHHGDASDPIAHGVATFMRASSKAVLGGQS